MEVIVLNSSLENKSISNVSSCTTSLFVQGCYALALTNVGFDQIGEFPTQKVSRDYAEFSHLRIFALSDSKYYIFLVPNAL